MTEPASQENKSKRILMLIPSVAKIGIDSDVASDKHPRMDYYALRDELLRRGHSVDLIDFSGIPTQLRGLRDIVLALNGARLANQYDTIFCNSESIALPLGILLKGKRKRPRVVGIGHRISTSKKRSFFTSWNAMNGVDLLFLYSSLQETIGIQSLGIHPKKLKRIQFHADERFFRPSDDNTPPKAPEGFEYQVCSAGLEWRDYPTLIEAARELPHVYFHIAAASPWSKHTDETQKVDLPANVFVKGHDYNSLRNLYRSSHLCVAPLYENDFQAGITTMLEAIACGLPVIATKTSGQTDAIIDGENGVYVPVGDSQAIRQSVVMLLDSDDRRNKLGKQARSWLEQNATLDLWTREIADSL